MADQFLNPFYRLPQTQPQGFLPAQQVEAPAAAFGAIGAQQLREGGAQVERASDAVQTIADKEMALANHARVENEVNQFISAKQNVLYTSRDAFYRKQGQEAINGAQAVTDSLIDLKKEAMARMANDLQRNALALRLDSEIREATSGMSRHVAAQSMVFQKQVAAGTQAMAQTEAAAAYNDDQLIDRKIADATQGALNQAHVEGHTKPDGMVDDSDPYVKALVLKAGGDVARVAIDRRLNNNQPRAALQLYERLSDKLGLKADEALDKQMRGVRTQIEAQDVANKALVNQGAPPIAGDANEARAYNIGNITKSGFNYAGGKVATEGPFEGFATPEHGVAAAQMTIDAKAEQNGGQISFRDLIAGNAKVKGWAPADDGKTPLLRGNKPEAYAAELAKAVGLQPGDNVPTGDPAKMAAVLGRMNEIEHGRRTVSDQNIEGGIKLAHGNTAAPQFKGDIGEAYRAAATSVANDELIPRTTRDGAVALLNQRRTALVGEMNAQVKSLQDEARTYRADIYMGASPEPQKLQDFANRARGLGQSELARQYDIFAQILPTLKNGLAMARPDQLQMLKALEESGSLPRKLLESVRPNDPEALQAANDAFAKLKQRHADGLPVGPGDVQPVAKMFGDLNRPEKVRELGAWASAATTAATALKLPRAQQEQMMTELEGLAQKGELGEQQSMLYHELKAGIAHQDEEFRKDPFAAGTKLMGVQPQPVDWSKPETVGVQLAQRSAWASQINLLHPETNALPFNKEEIAGLRDYMAKAGPDGVVKTIAALSALPDEHKLAVAAAIADKGKADPQSQMYGAAMAKWAENTPEGRAAAGEIARGAEIVKNSREGKPISATSPVMLQALSDKLGNALSLFSGTEVPSEMVEAIRASYAFRADKAGKQYEAAPDDTLLRQSIEAVTGGLLDFRGQKVFAPKAGATSYDLSAALGRLKDDDLPDGIQSLEGKPVTADMIKSRGVLYSYGDGQYVVKLPDRGGELKPVMDPRTGSAYVLGLRALLDRPGGELAAPEARGPAKVQPLMLPSDYSGKR